MPPRIPAMQAVRCCRASLESQRASSPLVSLFAALSIQTRSASILARLSDNPGAYHKRIRKGRGPSSGYGKTSGRGHKGQKQHGKVKPWFQGGQTPLIFSHGRKGFENLRAPKMSEVNLDRIQTWIDAGRLDPTKQITPRELITSGCVGNAVKDGIKLLAGSREASNQAGQAGQAPLRTAVDILVSRASAGAIEAVEAAGGKITTRFYTRQSIRRLVDGRSASTDRPLPVGAEHVEGELERVRQEAAAAPGRRLFRLPDPTSRWEIEYYRDPAHRGYLSHMLKPGQSPSLYFKVPGEKRVVVASKEKEKKKAAVEEDKLF
ncbi:putative 54s ribosomal protein l10 protein [Phialemonium atrogriseum]|uniref:54s ribosomal protein l10 protein n=1 Tax=Phialemonium atrogriseum TaxID=1093897 RepID=A0AAJ0FIJ0_9PEZI|nr:putative 54s ribosomal protein l10 protein [Phialemonium atrogriseum]KAK1764428.1 putative 54s ribosomal protein l10 protein [Phialemonium atrogriseum]